MYLYFEREKCTHIKMPKRHLKRINVEPHKDNKFKTNLHTIIEINNLITFIFGTLKFKIIRDKFVKIGKFYRSYAFLLTILFLFISILELKKFIENSLDRTFAIVLYIYISSLLISCFGYSYILLNNILNPDISIKLYKIITDIDEKLKTNTFSNTYKFKIMFIYFIYAIFIISIYFAESTGQPTRKNYIKELFYLSNICFDLEILNCVFTANEIACRFEVLKDCFKTYIIKNFDQNLIDFKLQENILKNIWEKAGSKSQQLTNNVTNMNVEKMISIFNSLINAVNCINTNFSIKVVFFNISLNFFNWKIFNIF